MRVGIEPSDTGPQITVELVAGRDELGLDIAIVYPPSPHDPAIIAPLGEAVAPVG